MVTYRLNGAILELTGTGTYTTDDIAEVLAMAKANPAFAIPMLLLIDIRESAMAHSFSDVRDRLLLVQQQFGTVMAPFVAFVVSGVARDRLAQISRSRATATGDMQIEVFTEVEAARDWLTSSRP